MRQRADRTLLVSLYEQKKQILQVKAEFFGDTNGAKNMLPPSHPAIVAAATFMTSIANAYAADRIKKHELKVDRDQRLKRIKNIMDAEKKEAEMKENEEERGEKEGKRKGRRMMIRIMLM